MVHEALTQSGNRASLYDPVKRAEELALYGKVEERLLKAGLKYDTAYEPTRIPKEQV
jgi:hypothetical protein